MFIVLHVNADAIWIAIVDGLGFVMIVKTLRKVACLPDIGKLMNPSSFLLIEDPGCEDIHGSDSIKFLADGINLKVVLSTRTPGEHGVCNFRHADSLSEGKRRLYHRLAVQNAIDCRVFRKPNRAFL